MLDKGHFCIGLAQEHTQVVEEASIGKKTFAFTGYFCIHVIKGTILRLGVTKYSYFKKIVYPRLDLVSLNVLT